MAAAAYAMRPPVDEATSVTGQFLYASHRGGAEVEYVEWIPELVERIVRAQPE